MGISPAIIAIAGLVVGAAGTAVSFVQQQKAAKESKKATQEQQRQEQLRIRRQRRQVIREQQIKRAQIANFAEGSGIGGSSSPLGANTGLGSQAGTAIGAGAFVGASNAKIGMHQQRALDAQGTAQLASGVASLGFQAANFGIGQGAFQNARSPTPSVGQSRINYSGGRFGGGNNFTASFG